MSRPATFIGVRAEPSFGPSCNGCPSNGWSARYGVSGDPTPRSWCLALRRAIPMVLSSQDVWLRSELPGDCAVHAQRPLFEP